ncbi:MalY/PatB family protein, partial [Georgenia sp.]
MGFDDITVEQLRAAHGLKWGTYPDRIPLWVAEMDLGIPAPVRAVLERAIDTGNLGYLPGADHRALQEATAAHLARTNGWHVAPEQVYPVPDVLSVLRETIRHLTAPGSPVIVPTPAYMPFLTVPPAVGRDVVEVPSLVDAAGRYSLDLDGIDAAFTAGAGLLVLCNPWNPVGRVLEEAELLALADVVERHNGRVFADEIHAPLVLDDAGHAPYTGHVSYAALDDRTARHTVTAIAASKGWNVPGLKCAQMVLSHEDDIAAYAPYAADVASTVGLLGARAATAVYTDDGGWLAEVVPYLRSCRDLLEGLVAEHLPGAVLSPVAGTYIGWLDCRGVGFAAPAAAFLRREAGV